jgi:hypothetical protein
MVWLDPAIVDRLKAMLGPSESYSEVQRGECLSERREALALWARIVTGKPGQVVVMSSAKRKRPIDRGGV